MTFTVALAACNPARGSSGRGGLQRWGEAVPGPSVSAEVPVRATDRGPIRIEPLPGIDPPVFAHHGRPRGPGKLVFLHGMCGHGMGYAQAFQFAAARYGTLIAPQGDSRCGNGPWAKWSRDLEALDRRILEGFRALGLAEPIEDVIVIGYSMGATRALELARKYPARYSSVILMGAPAAPTPGAASGLRAAVMMAGEHDRQDQMRAGVRAFQRANIPATFILIPEAQHGAMGPRPEQTMGQALDWLAQNRKPLVQQAASAPSSG